MGCASSSAQNTPPLSDIKATSASTTARGASREATSHRTPSVQPPQQKSRQNTNVKPRSPLGHGGQDASQVAALKKYENKIQKNFKKAARLDKEGPMDIGRAMLIGDHVEEVKQSFKTVRIFTSSTFTDTKHERNMLMEKVYPQLQSFCHGLGYDFQVVDMRWGIRDDAEDDHSTIETCMREIQACQKVSTGPTFVTFLSHKYGYRPLPRTMAAAELEQVTKDIGAEDKEIFDKALKKDLNAVPAEYVLQPVSSLYPEFKSNDREMHISTWKQWTADVKNPLQDILVSGARRLGDEDLAHKYSMSVTEREIRSGVKDAENVSKKCLWFKRKFVDIDVHQPSKNLSRYYECTNEEKDVKARDSMKKLRDTHLPKWLPATNIVDYEIHWDVEHGVEPSLPEHEAYLNELCNNFEEQLKQQILVGIHEEEARISTEPLQQEIIQHSAFRQSKCSQFYGREALLRNMDNYLTDKSATTPLILYGDSGCGKTSLVAKLATKAWDTMNKKAVIIYRFIGTSQNSSSIRPLLDSINSQIISVYAPSMARRNESSELKQLKEEFLLYVSCIPEERPLVIILDSLDQLDSADGGRQLDWLPKELPGSVRIVLSTLPQDQYVTFPRCKAIYPDNKWFVAVPHLSSVDVNGILSKWLKSAKRTLVPTQRALVVEAMTKNPLPLYLKLSFDEARRWTSYAPPEMTVVQDTVIQMINALFDRVEKAHGKILVSYALAYLTIAQVGVSEVEMEDLLSLNDNVLSDVYQFWTPPIRRLPPLLWVRIKNDLREYIVSRGADEIQVIYWYHRQFIETAYSRYVGNEELEKECHRDIAEYFIGTWTGKAKPYKEKSGKLTQALRYVSEQPLRFEKNYNIRKLNQLPYHLIKAGDLHQMKEHVFCNYEFLLAKLMGLGLRPALVDLKAAQMSFPKDRDLSIILETLQLSSDALSHSPVQLAGQLAGRIHGYGSGTVAMVQQAEAMLIDGGNLESGDQQMMAGLVKALKGLMAQMDADNKNLNNLLQQANESSIPVLVPHTGFLMPPGGQLLHKLSGHLEKINDLDMTKDGKLLATGSDDKTVKFWNPYTGDILKSVDVSTEVKFIRFLPHPSKLLAISCTMGHILVVDSKTGEVVTKMKTTVSNEYMAQPMTVIATKNKNQVLVVALRNQFIDLFDAASGKLVAAFEDNLKSHKSRLWGEQKVLTASKHYIAYSAFADDDFYVVPVDALDSMQVYKENVFAEEAEWLNLESKDHISDMIIAEGANQLVICNGKTKDLLFYGLENREQLYIIKNSADSINDMQYSLKEHALYYAADNEVAQAKAGSKEFNLTFRHPCKVLKVMGQDGRVVVTVAEDNILRVWDKLMEPFTLDLSEFTGKVHVHSDNAGDVLKSMMGNMDVSLSGLDTQSVLTTKDAKNYWTKIGQSKMSMKDKVVTKFHPFYHNPRYVMATHNCQDEAAIMEWTKCLTIWDMSNVTCVRRLFLPEHMPGTLGSIYVHGMADDNTAVLQEYGLDISYKLLDLQTWDMQELSMENYSKKVWKSLYKRLYHKNVFVLETCYNQLTVFSVHQSNSVAAMTVHTETEKWHMKQIDLSFPYRTKAMEVHKFDDIKVSEDESYLVTSWGRSVVSVWDTSAWTLLNELRVKDYFSDFLATDNQLSLSEVASNTYVVVNANVPAKDSKKHNASCVYKITSGRFIDYTLKKANALELKQAQVTDVVAVLQQLPEQEHKLQWIAVGEHGVSFIMGEENLGFYADNLMTSDDNKKFVTWCSSMLDKTLRLFGMSESGFNTIGAFTADHEVSHVALVEDNTSVVINSPTGLVKLQLRGHGMDTPMLSDESARILYRDTDLDVQLNGLSEATQ